MSTSSKPLKKLKEHVPLLVGASGGVEIVRSISALKARPSLDVSRVVLSSKLSPSTDLDRCLQAGVEVGAAFVDLPLRGVLLEGGSADETLRLSFGLLQATRRKI